MPISLHFIIITIKVIHLWFIYQGYLHNLIIIKAYITVERFLTQSRQNIGKERRVNQTASNLLFLLLLVLFSSKGKERSGRICGRVLRIAHGFSVNNACRWGKGIKEDLSRVFILLICAVPGRSIHPLSNYIVKPTYSSLLNPPVPFITSPVPGPFPLPASRTWS